MKKNTKNIKISACMMVKNEEEMLPRCLNSIKHLIDELIVVDTGSTDKTIEIAESFGAKMYHHPWENNFSKHRNQSLGYATGDWILLVDADEELDAYHLKKNDLKKKLKKAPKALHCYLIKVLDKKRDGQIATATESIRIFRNHVGIEYRGIVHNKLHYSGKVGHYDLKLFHYGYALSDSQMQAKYKRTSGLLFKRIEKNPEDYDAYFYLYQVHSEMGEKEQAVEYAQRCLGFIEQESLDPTEASFYYSLYYGIANISLKSGEYDRALSAVRKGLEVLPDEVDLYYVLAATGYFTGQPNLAIEGGEDYFRVLGEFRSDPSRCGTRFIFTTSKGAELTVSFWLMTGLIASDQFAEFSDLWEKYKEDMLEKPGFQKELFKVLEKKDAFEQLEPVAVFLLNNFGKINAENHTMILSSLLFCLKEKAIYQQEEDDESKSMFEGVCTRYLDIVDSYQAIPTRDGVILSQLLLARKMGNFFLDLTLVLFKREIEGKIKELDTNETLAYGYDLIAKKQKKDRKGKLISILCWMIAWELTKNDLYQQAIKNMNTEDKESSKLHLNQAPNASDGSNITFVETNVAAVESKDVYLKQVPREMHYKKTGMNICIIADFNIAGNLTGLMRAINKYTQHKARCIIWHDDHFSYDKDIILDECNNNYEEAAEIANKADFFHFGRYIFNIPGVDFNKLVNPRNSLVAYYGTYLRTNGPKLNEWHKKTGIAALTGNDFTTTPLLDNPYYHVDHFYFSKYGDMDIDQIPIAEKPDGKIKITAGSAGGPTKGYDILQSTVAQLQADRVPVELDLIKGISNAECLKRKEKAQMTFTALFGGWGLSGVESMFIGHAVLCCLDAFVMSRYPNNPTVIINRENLYDKIRFLAEHPDELVAIGQKSREFALNHFRVKDILKGILYTYDVIMHHNELQKNLKNPTYYYSF